MTTMKFSEAMLERLRVEYSKIKTVDVESPALKAMTGLLDQTPLPALKQLADARIPFVSALARNRVNLQEPPENPAV